MPELPEVETVVSELNHKLKGKTVRSVSVLRAKIVSLGPDTVSNIRRAGNSTAKSFAQKIKGQKIKSVSRRAKLLIFKFYPATANIRNLTPNPSPLSPFLISLPRHGEMSRRDREVEPLELPLIRPRATFPLKGEGNNESYAERVAGDQVRLEVAEAGECLFLLVHLKMTGQFIYLKKSELDKKIRIVNKINAAPVSLPAKHTHVVFTFTDGAKLFYNDVRQFGYLKLITDEQLSRVKEFADFGPEPLDKKFTLPAFFTVVKKAGNRKTPIKTLLMDSTFISGIGNIYSDEILFRARISPSRRIRSFKSAEINVLYRAIRFVLKKGIAAHGSSVGDFIRTDGSFGTMGKYHFVYGRAGESCKVCGTIIKSEKFGGRTGSYCPKCQK
ncbi:MAG: DNA-formamidopyrimidine glycosylase family protein [bacterium]|nr:DNA-formamidopyrimidine glycosylase family protein [bacterium]